LVEPVEYILQALHVDWFGNDSHVHKALPVARI